MKISTRGRYGLRAVIDLAMQMGEGCVPLGDIARRQDLSLNYLEGIFSYLKRAGVVTGVAGAQGGYLLAKQPEEISVRDLMLVLEGNMSVSDPPSPDASPFRRFLQRKVWDEVDKKVEKTLSEITLKDLTEQFQHQESSVLSSGL